MANLEDAQRARNDGRRFAKVLRVHFPVSRDGTAVKRRSDESYLPESIPEPERRTGSYLAG